VTTRYTDGDLEALLADIESDLAERKESLRGDAPETVRQAVCAFANDLPDHRKAGVVFVGARDDGTPTGIPVTDELLINLANIKTDGNTLPPPTITVEKRHLRGSDMAVLSVEPADSPPVRFKGRVWIRIGPRRGIATAQDERILSEKRRSGDLPFDAQPVPTATVADINVRLFEEEYLPSAFAQDVLAANDRTPAQRLTATKMVSGPDAPVPTVLGLLVLGIRTRDFLPGAYVQFLRFGGTSLGDPVIDEQVLDGPVGDVIRRVDDKLQSHNRTAVDLTSGQTEVRVRPYPQAALQQIVRNAIMHRAYQATNAPVRVLWFDDRIEILSPGGPFGLAAQGRFGDPGVVDYRNPNLAEALKVLGFVQRFGVGIATARRELEKNGNPPLAFDANPAQVLCTLRARP
jgi:ATP-dependent DNA helicase RecG